MSLKPRWVIATLAAASLSCFTGCDDVDWPDPRYIDSLRILGVQADPPTLTPGGSTRLSMICADGSRGPGTEPTCDAEIAWFAQCNNPDQNDPDRCLGRFEKWTDRLAEHIAETPVEAYPEGFGFGSTFTFSAPEDILNDKFDAAGLAVRYGTSYVFFAACAGQLTRVRGVSDRLPVECRDRVTGQLLGQQSFVVGATTLYSYDSVYSRNPVVLTAHFDGTDVSARCNTTDDCPSGFECSTENQCLPVVQACAEAQSDNCPGHSLDLDIGSDSFSLFPLDGSRLGMPRKSVWLSYFTDSGQLPEDDARFGIDAPADESRFTRTQSMRWQPPTLPTEHAHLWAVIRDNRGGLALWEQRILVR